jgi:TolB protein
MNADGSNVVNLTNHSADDGRPAWSPDDERIAFISNRDGNYEIYVMNADGSDPQRYTNHPELDAFPEWSPDGQYIAFRSDRAGNLEVFVLAVADPSTPFNWTNHPSSDCHPRWTAAAGATVRVQHRSRIAPAAVTASPRVAPVNPSLRTSIENCLGE